MPAKLQDYDVLAVIGSGSFSSSFKVQHSLTKDVFVWKAVDYLGVNKKSKQIIDEKLKILEDISHVNIVKYFSKIIHEETSTLYVIREWYQGPNLTAKILEGKKLSCRVEEWFLWRVCHQMSRALDCLHSHGIVHGNVKPSNIIIFEEEKANLKLTDCELLKSHEIASPYKSPEELANVHYDEKSDIWALGCVLFELATYTLPYSGITVSELLSSIKSTRCNVGDLIDEEYSISIRKMIDSMLIISPSTERPDSNVLSRHPIVVSKCVFPEKRECAIPQLSDNVSSRLANLTIDREPEAVSYGLFRKKWVSRLEVVRNREARVEVRETEIAKRERRVASLERRVQLLENRRRKKIRNKSLPRHLSSVKIPSNDKNCYDDDDVSYSLEPGIDSSPTVVTSARLNPCNIVRPSFKSDSVNHVKSAKMKLLPLSDSTNKHVHFQNEHGNETGRESKLSKSSGSSKASSNQSNSLMSYAFKNIDATKHPIAKKSKDTPVQNCVVPKIKYPKNIENKEPTFKLFQKFFKKRKSNKPAKVNSTPDIIFYECHDDQNTDNCKEVFQGNNIESSVEYPLSMRLTKRKSSSLSNLTSLENKDELNIKTVSEPTTRRLSCYMKVFPKQRGAIDNVVNIKNNV